MDGREGKTENLHNIAPQPSADRVPRGFNVHSRMWHSDGTRGVGGGTGKECVDVAKGWSDLVRMPRGTKARMQQRIEKRGKRRYRRSSQALDETLAEKQPVGGGGEKFCDESGTLKHAVRIKKSGRGCRQGRIDR